MEPLFIKVSASFYLQKNVNKAERAPSSERLARFKDNGSLFESNEIKPGHQTIQNCLGNQITLLCLWPVL
jgi:hypothetical protein